MQHRSLTASRFPSVLRSKRHCRSIATGSHACPHTADPALVPSVDWEEERTAASVSRPLPSRSFLDPSPLVTWDAAEYRYQKVTLVQEAETTKGMKLAPPLE